MCSNLFVLLFLVTSCLIVAVQPCMEWIPIKKYIYIYIQNLVYSKSQTKTYLTPCPTSTIECIVKIFTAIVVVANYFCNISFSHSLLISIKIYFLLQKYLFHTKNYCGPGGSTIIQKKWASHSRMLPLVMVDKTVPFFPKIKLF